MEAKNASGTLQLPLVDNPISVSVILGIPGNGHFRVHHHGPVVDNVRKDAVGNRFLVGGNLHNLPVVPATHALSRLQLANRDVVPNPVRAVRAEGDQGPTGRQGRASMVVTISTFLSCTKSCLL